MRTLLLTVCLCLLPGQLMARTAVALPDATPLTKECVASAARAANLPLPVLYGILATEGGRAGEAWSNTNGTWDLGPFQVNTCHLNDLARLGIQPETVMRDSCVNAYAAAWIVRQNLQRTGGDLWEAVGWYHSRTPRLKHAYIRRVKHNLARIESKGTSGLPLARTRHEAVQ